MKFGQKSSKRGGEGNFQLVFRTFFMNEYFKKLQNQYLSPFVAQIELYFHLFRFSLLIKALNQKIKQSLTSKMTLNEVKRL